MDWIHFSDFHIRNKPGPQDEAMASLIDFLGLELKGSKIDAVFLVGDIAYSGRSDEYSRFETLFLSPLLKLPEVKGAKVFAVPGNHDVDCDAADPITWEGIKERNQSIYFHEGDVGVAARRRRTAIFNEYKAFVERNSIFSPDPMTEVSHLFNAEQTGFPCDIVATNTSFFCDREEKSDEPIQPSPITSLRDRSRGIRDRPLLILGHHPTTCLLPAQQKPFDSFLIDKTAAYLHGHEHNPKLVANVDGTLRTLGFGATYLASLGSPAHAPYKNSFALCTLSNKLRIRGYSWDYEVGRWDDTTRSQFSSALTSTTYDGNAITLTLPNSVSSTPTTQVIVLDQIARKTPDPAGIAIVTLPSSRQWLRLLSLSKNYSAHYRNDIDPTIQSEKTADGKSEFILEDADKRDLLVCIPGSSHVLSAKEIESFNTRMDTEDFRSISVLSFGKISPDARNMYLRLHTRKPLEVLTNKDIATRCRELFSVGQAEVLSASDAATDTVEALIDGDDLVLLIVTASPSRTFRVVSKTGETLPPSHPLIARLRHETPSLSRMGYSGESGRSHEEAPDAFEEMAYLKRCHAESNVMKYAALANIGLRFSDFALTDLYIDASACEVDKDNAGRLGDLLDDHLASYPATEQIKLQIKQQFLNQTQGLERQETSQAREFCQRFGAVLLTGDPGSGKTCFVKNEILAYSKRAMGDLTDVAEQTEDWHSTHVPILIPLSQAAAEPDLQSAGLLPIASRLLERRGFNFPAEKMDELLKQGRLSLFFDGLDEVVSVEKRAIVVQHINELVTDSLARGNRIVVTSRQAAVNVVNLLPTLRQLELQGLTENEIRTLANRILTLRLSESGDEVILDEGQLQLSDSFIVRQLLNDCRDKPGVARLAKNPLLLTLLVMIYANSGAPSAKRHLIYEEAIKTLAAVRGRQTGHDPVSAQDLRERLGAVALSVYRKESGFLPNRAEVAEVIRGVMSRQRGSEVARVEADAFIQKVAESTGLIAIGGNGDVGDDAAIVTFMHHSFMEYFAAAGLSREMDKIDIVSLITQPRWVEVLTLLSGLIGETTDIAPVLSRFIGDGSEFGPVDAKLLLFALDCALECEVPSEAATRLLSLSIVQCVQKGPARSDPWVRAEIGGRLSQLVAACGITAFEGTLSALVRNTDPNICAAAISLTAHACSGETRSDSIMSAIDDSCSRTEEVVHCAVCEAATRAEWLRTPVVLQHIAKCLHKSPRCRASAFEAILNISGLAAKHWPEIINGLGETAPGLRRLASKVAISAGLDGDIASLDDAKKDVVVSALQCIYESGADSDYPNAGVEIETIDRLMSSGFLRDRIIGTQLIPVARSDNPSYAHDRLIAILNSSEDNQEITAALRALRSGRDAQMLLTTGELKRVIKLLETGTSDVRKASIRLLSNFVGEAYAVRSLIDRDMSSLGHSEYALIFSALGRAPVLKDEILALIQSEIGKRLPESTKKNDAYATEMSALLDASRELGRSLDSEISESIQTKIQDYREREEVRRSALLAYPAVVMPSKQVVEFLTQLFKSPPQIYRVPPTNMLAELAQTPSIFAKSCRKSVDHVIASVEAMGGLRDAATDLHQKLVLKPTHPDNEAIVSTLRDGIHEITQIIVTFDEFINQDNSARK